MREDRRGDPLIGDLRHLQERLDEIGRERTRLLTDLAESGRRADEITGAQRILRERADGIHLQTCLSELDEDLQRERETAAGLRSSLVRLAMDKNTVIAAINRQVRVKEGDPRRP